MKQKKFEVIDRHQVLTDLLSIMTVTNSRACEAKVIITQCVSLLDHILFQSCDTLDTEAGFQTEPRKTPPKSLFQKKEKGRGSKANGKVRTQDTNGNASGGPSAQTVIMPNGIFCTESCQEGLPLGEGVQERRGEAQERRCEVQERRCTEEERRCVEEERCGGEGRPCEGGMGTLDVLLASDCEFGLQGPDEYNLQIVSQV